MNMFMLAWLQGVLAASAWVVSLKVLLRASLPPGVRIWWGSSVGALVGFYIGTASSVAYSGELAAPDIFVGGVVALVFLLFSILITIQVPRDASGRLQASQHIPRIEAGLLLLGFTGLAAGGLITFVIVATGHYGPETASIRLGAYVLWLVSLAVTVMGAVRLWRVEANQK